MDRLSKKQMLENCTVCGESFNDVKRQAKNMCVPCYRRDYYENKIGHKKSKYTECSVCGVKEGEKTRTGRLDWHLIRGYCPNCYYKHYVTTGCKNCTKCGVEFKGTKIDCLCDFCRPDRRTDKAKIKKLKRGELMKREQLTKEQLSLMLTLFRRYKNGTQDMVDAFRVASLYLDVFDGHPFVYNSMLDSYNEESQIVLMLRQLKGVYDNVATKK